MKFKKTLCLALTIALTSFTIGCNKEKYKQTSLKSKLINFIDKKNSKQQDETLTDTIADSIKINIDKYEIKNDYENKPTIVIKIRYKNLSKDIKILDSEDISLYQGKYKLKSVYDTQLNTEAFYEEIKPNQSKTFILGYRVEGNNDFILKFNPFLSKQNVNLEIEYPKSNTKKMEVKN